MFSVVMAFGAHSEAGLYHLCAIQCAGSGYLGTELQLSHCRSTESSGETGSILCIVIDSFRIYILDFGD